MRYKINQLKPIRLFMFARKGATRLATVLMGLAAFFLCAPSWAEYGLNLTKGVTPISAEVYDLHMLIFWICVAIAVVVFSILIWAIVFFRKSRGAVADTTLTHSTRLEIIWTIIPIIILIGMAVPATRVLIAMEDTSEPDMTIKVTGYQWKWRYDYLDEGIGFFSSLDEASNKARQRNSGIDPRSVENYLLEVDEPVVVPINKKIRFLTTANDVLHSWWVPDLGWKRDAIPGYINSSWALVTKPGVYRGQCAELCGKDHGFMPVVLHAVSEEEYRAWVDEKKEQMEAADADATREFTLDELMARGEKVYQTNCAACHQPGGTGLPGAFPALKGVGLAIGPAVDHLNIVIHGKAGTAMAAFGPQLGDADIAAVVTYERNSWGNDALVEENAIVQPAMVAAQRGAKVARP